MSDPVAITFDPTMAIIVSSHWSGATVNLNSASQNNASSYTATTSSGDTGNTVPVTMALNAPTYGITSIEILPTSPLASYPGYVRSADRFLPNSTTVDTVNGGYWGLTNRKVNPFMFGAIGNLVADDFPAFNAMLAYCWRNSQGNFAGTAGGPISLAPVSEINVDMPNCTGYSLSQKLIIKKGIQIYGHNSLPVQFSTTLQFPLGQGGIFIPNTAGAVTLKDFVMYGTYDPTQSLPPAHGVETRSPLNITNVSVDRFSGDGHRYDARTQFAFTTDDSVSISCQAYLCGFNGFYVFGGDANVMTFINPLANSNLGFGMRDDSLFGNTWIGVETNSNGRQRAAISTVISGSTCTFGGLVYAVVPVQQQAAYPLASTTQPGTDPTIWFPTGITPASLGNPPTWTSGAFQFAPGGPYCSLSGINTIWLNPYAEANQAPSIVLPYGLVIGGVQGSAPLASPTNFFGNVLNVTPTLQGVQSSAKIAVVQPPSPSIATQLETITSALGVDAVAQTTRRWGGSTTAPSLWYETMNFTTGDVDIQYGIPGATQITLSLSGPNTTSVFGTPAWRSERALCE